MGDFVYIFCFIILSSCHVESARSLASEDFPSATPPEGIYTATGRDIEKLDDRVKWLEHVVIGIHKLKGITGATGATGMQGLSGKCDDAAIAALLRSTNDFIYMKEEVNILRGWMHKLSASITRMIITVAVIMVIWLYKLFWQ